MENMIEKNKINNKLPIFSNRCFWEQEYTRLDFNLGRRYIITKVISFGSQDDYKELFNFYGWDVIKSEVIKIRYLNRKILNFLSILFDVKKESFRAFSNQGLF